MTQNRSSAVMQQRAEPDDSLDDFPTPSWATRALLVTLAMNGAPGIRGSVWEPAANRGFMVRPLAEQFEVVFASDAHDYGYGYQPLDFLFPGTFPAFDWIITNPPFRLAREFILTALERATYGVAMLVRTAFLEGCERHETLFRLKRPNWCLQFVERVPMVRGRCDGRASTATSYCWLVWIKQPSGQLFSGTTLDWIPPCRKRLEKAGDYDLPQRVAA